MHNPADMPSYSHQSIEERIKATIMTPDEYLGQVLSLCVERREAGRSDLCWEPGYGGLRLPLNEVVFDFYDRLKSVTRGYATLIIKWTVMFQVIWSVLF